VKTRVWAGLVLVGLAACTSPQVPDSGAGVEAGSGVGFGDYADYELQRLRREAALTGQPFVPPTAAPAAQPQTTIGPNPNAAIPTSELAAAGIGVPGPDGITSGGLGNATTIDPTAAANAATGFPAVDTAPLNETAEQRERRLANNPAISDEQDFAAVTSRETIESDAQRRAEQADNLVVVEPVPLPSTRADSGPNIVQYAINAPNQKGQQWYSRSILSGDNRFQRNCATYSNPDAAQRDFLVRGGPERDPRGIDPDGDGFACGWDPRPFRAAAGN